jgi:hypothetical protein
MRFEYSMRDGLKLCVLAACLAVSAMPALAQPRVDTPPDWPCVQVFVPTLSAATIWAGPPVEDQLKTWVDNRDIASLAPKVLSRSTSDDEATAAVEDFAQSLKANRNETLTALFAGIFDEANRARSRAIDAIRKFDGAQKAQIASMTRTVTELDQARTASPRDEAKVRELSDRLAWQRRIIEERHRSQGALCEQPVIVERRVGQLARAIANEMD